MNPNIKYEIKTSAKTDIGKFRRDLGKFSREKVPVELVELFDWYKGLDTREINYILEMKNLYLTLQKAMIPKLVERLEHGEMPSKREIDAMRLLKDIMNESHKLKYGDHKVIEKVVSYKDVRNQIFSEQKNYKTVEVTRGLGGVYEPVSQDLDRSGRAEGAGEKDGEDPSIDPGAERS